LGDRLLKISPEGKVKKIAEGFSRCFDVKLDNKGNIYVADDKVDIIYKFSPSMKKTIYYKGKLTGDFILTSLAFDKKFENLYAREGNKIIKFKINPNGSQSKPVCIANKEFIFNICIDNNNNIYGCTTTPKQKIDKKGKITILADLLVDPDGFCIGKTGFNQNTLYVTEANGIVKVKLGK
ncbi:MAG TPA: hypothetical protein VHT34_09680, partial [Clostridia bacterium]|nr:hypothetical protein [Clostridia bacterium]